MKEGDNQPVLGFSKQPHRYDFIILSSKALGLDKNQLHHIYSGLKLIVAKSIHSCCTTVKFFSHSYT